MEPDDILDEGLAKEVPLPRNLSIAYLFLVAIVPVIAGVLIGLATNGLNLYIFPGSFPLARMVQGVEESLAFSLVFGAIFTLVIVLDSERRTSNRRLLKIYLQCAIIVVGCWILVGAVGAVLYQHYENIDPFNKFVIRRFRAALGWKRLSVWGSRLGGLVALAWAIYASRPSKLRLGAK